jgi:nucleotide-binding universal stress UspA family protein
MNVHVPLRSILLATNLSDMEWLFPFACSLAEESGASITLLHVLTAMHGMCVDMGGMPYYRPDEAIAAITPQLQELCGVAHTAEIQCEAMVIAGNPVDVIHEIANRVHADLLIMGTRGHRGIEKWLLGSVAETILRSSPIPVVAVGPNARKFAALRRPVKSILFSTSLKKDSRESTDLAYKWSKRLCAHLTLLHAMQSRPKDELEYERIYMMRENELRALLPDQVFREQLAEVQIQSGRPARVILAASTCADLIILGTRPNPALGRLAPEGILYQVLMEAHCPVATIHS